MGRGDRRLFAVILGNTGEYNHDLVCWKAKKTKARSPGQWRRLELVKNINLLYHIQNVQDICLVLEVCAIFQPLNQLVTVHVTTVISGPLEVVSGGLGIQTPKSEGEVLSMRTFRRPGSDIPTRSWNPVTAVLPGFSEFSVAFCLYVLLFLISESLG